MVPLANPAESVVVLLAALGIKTAAVVATRTPVTGGTRVWRHANVSLRLKLCR